MKAICGRTLSVIFLLTFGLFASAQDWEAVTQQAEAGDVNVQLTLGKGYFSGNALAQDYKAAFHWFEAAAQQDSAEGEAWLGDLYMTGKGVTRDLTKALALEQSSAQAGNAAGQTFLGMMYESGLGVTKDKYKAEKCYEHAAHQNYPRAMALLGAWNLRNNKGMRTSLATARSFFRNSALLGDEWGETYWGEMNFLGTRGAPVDYAEAFKDLTSAAAQGNKMAEHLLGEMYAQGAGCDKDATKAAEWYKKSALQHYAPAEASLGSLYQSGNGVSQDSILAYAWTDLAARQKNPDAVKALAALQNSLMPVQIAAAKAAEATLLTQQTN